MKYYNSNDTLNRRRRVIFATTGRSMSEMLHNPSKMVLQNGGAAYEALVRGHGDAISGGENWREYDKKASRNRRIANIMSKDVSISGVTTVDEEASALANRLEAEASRKRAEDSGVIAQYGDTLTEEPIRVLNLKNSLRRVEKDLALKYNIGIRGLLIGLLNDIEDYEKALADKAKVLPYGVSQETLKGIYEGDHKWDKNDVEELMDIAKDVVSLNDREVARLIVTSLN